MSTDPALDISISLTMKHLEMVPQVHHGYTERLSLIELWFNY